jgi:hypothetical protein
MIPHEYVVLSLVAAGDAGAEHGWSSFSGVTFPRNDWAERAEGRLCVGRVGRRTE